MRPQVVLALSAALAVAGCAARVPAPVDDRRPLPAEKPAAPKPAPAATPTAAAPGTYVVKRGDTLYSIALEHGLDYRDLARWNALEDPARIRVGQVLRVTPPEERPRVEVGSVRAVAPIEARPLEAPPPAAGDGALRASPKALRLPYSEQNLALLQRGETGPAKSAPPAAGTKPEPQKPDGARAAAEPIEFTWPARGTVIAGFSEPRVKGIDIGGRLGDPVVAAAPGKVIYVGSGIPGLGKFVVIKHNDEYSTVYAHAREVLVKMDQMVERGQRIAEMGDTDADRPKLHFQIRRLGRPLDPLSLLPPPG
ncbi:MAG: peptidoglycan DD-metalloendopeptidase family protein [Burkholderiales bacterium]|nr:peptidoglycan DD-metalloendopeptidase family protein [Burkholderiales bacterium]